MSNYPEKFKASKGWFEKFLIRLNTNLDSNRFIEEEIILDSRKSNSEKEYELSFKDKFN